MAETKRSPRPDAAWFDHDRFGMFVHWGLYSAPAGMWKGKKNKHPYAEWLQASEHVPRPEYQKLAAEFNPVGFDADAWILAAKDAGMKYFIITAKHHDGFALWPSKASAYNVMDATPFKRDILGELAAACAKHGVKFGLYYSHWQDWEGNGGDVCQTHMVNEEYVHPTQEQFEHYWRNKCLPQVRELIENYDPWFLWFDSWSNDALDYITDRRQDELIDLIRAHSSKCLVNSRIRYTAPSDRVDVLSMMDNCYPEQSFDRPWETSGTLNHSWAYHQADFAWKSTRQLLQFLINNASHGGNYQLNVGPTGDGEFQPAALKRLREIGCWLAVNGEAVYGAEKSPFAKPDWGRITTRPNTLYLHLYDFTPGGALLLEPVKMAPTKAWILETSQELLVSATPEGLWVRLPLELAAVELPVIRLDFEPGALEI